MNRVKKTEATIPTGRPQPALPAAFADLEGEALEDALAVKAYLDEAGKAGISVSEVFGVEESTVSERQSRD